MVIQYSIMKTLNGNSFKKMIIIIGIIFGILIGIFCDRLYIIQHIVDDIEYNQALDNQTALNIEHTDKKIYVLDYIRRLTYGD